MRGWNRHFGRRAAFATATESWRPRLYAAAWWLTGRPLDAVSLLEVTYTAAYATFDRRLPDSAVGLWLYRAMHTRLLAEFGAAAGLCPEHVPSGGRSWAGPQPPSALSSTTRVARSWH